MTYTSYVYYPTGSNLYAKAEPLNTGTWSTGVVNYTENGSTGSYAATLDSATAYAIYKRAGGSPASSDLKIGYETTRPEVNLPTDPADQSLIMAELASIKAQTDLLGSGTVVQSSAVASNGTIEQIVIGDDYLNANGRAFSWTITEPTGVTAATATATFGLKDKDGNTFSATATPIDNGSTWTLRFDVDRTKTGGLVCGPANWSVEVRAADGTEITTIRQSDSDEPTQIVEKFT